MRIIADGEEGSKDAKSFLQNDLLVVASIVLTATAALGLGFLWGREEGKKGEMTVTQASLPASAISGTQEAVAAASLGKAATSPSTAAASAAPNSPAASATVGVYVASKSGTKYYLPSCGTVARIKEENKVWFATKADAEAAGYTPSSTCKGL